MLLRREDDWSPHTTRLELILITIALITSVVLSLIPSNRSLAKDHRGKPSFVLTVSSIMFALVALVVSITSIVLGWLKWISLDALSTVVFASVPAVINMPVDTMQHAYLRMVMTSYKSLSLSATGVCFASLHVPRTNADSTIYDSLRASDLEVGCAPVTVCIRYLAGSDSSGMLLGKRRRNGWRNIVAFNCMGEELQRKGNHPSFDVNGIMIDRTANTVSFRNRNFGSRDRWWRSISSATWLVARPWLVYLNTSEQMLQALALLSDIIAIGKIILYHRRPLLRHHLKRNVRLRRGMNGTASVVCNAILDELGLKDWGKAGPEMELLVKGDPAYLTKEHGILFYIITVTSCLYGAKSYAESQVDTVLEKTRARRDEWRKGKVVTRLSAQTVLDDLQRSSLGSAEFDQLVRCRIDDWLASWGCTQSFECVLDGTTPGTSLRFGNDEQAQAYPFAFDIY